VLRSMLGLWILVIRGMDSSVTLHCMSSMWIFLFRCMSIMWILLFRCMSSIWILLPRCMSSILILMIRCMSCIWILLLRCMPSTVSGCLICEEFGSHCYAVSKYLDSYSTQHAKDLDEELGDSLL
jgi:hypothetical protein